MNFFLKENLYNLRLKIPTLGKDSSNLSYFTQLSEAYQSKFESV